MLTIALTGGIASGKTMVSDQFAHLGIPIIDADEISRALLSGSLSSSPSAALVQIESQFGTSFFDTKGQLIRSKLKHHIFSSKNAASHKNRLENIIHPLVFQQIKHQIDDYSLAGEPTSSYIIISIPLLVESANKYDFDRVLVVDIDKKTQIDRCAKRDNLSAQAIEDIINAQASRQQRLAIANDVIDNNQSISQLYDAVNQLHQRYLKLAQQNKVAGNAG